MPSAILYTFRRCPYAMRARLGLLLSQIGTPLANQADSQTADPNNDQADNAIEIEVREITLKAKPLAMLAVSPKGTVPVLVLECGHVIDESIDIMRWALTQSDPFHLLCQPTPHLADSPAQDAQIQTVNTQIINALIQQNDQQFKPWLDRYKYADRHPEESQSFYYQQSGKFLHVLESQLNLATDDNNGQRYLCHNRATLADYAIMPFIRQFAAVNSAHHFSQDFPQLAHWLAHLTNSDIFMQAMQKYPVWSASQSENILLGRILS